MAREPLHIRHLLKAGLLLVAVALIAGGLLFRASRGTAPANLVLFRGFNNDSGGLPAPWFSAARGLRITVSPLGRSNDGSGIRVPYFCMSNRTSKEVVYLSDGNGRPYYHVFQVLGTQANGGPVVVTNHNLKAFRTVRPASLPPHRSVDFPVSIPTGVTNAIVVLNFQPEHRLWDPLVRNVKKTVGLPSLPASQYQSLALSIHD